MISSNIQGEMIDMIGIQLLSAISYFSFVFTILCYILPFATVKNFILMYILAVFVGYIGLYLKEKGKHYLFTGALMGIPIIFFREERSLIFVFVLVFSFYYYLKKSAGKNDYGAFVENFKKGLSVFVFLIGISILIGTINLLSKFSAHYMIIYFLSTVVLVRSLRHIQYSKDIERINKLNIRYSILITEISLILSVEEVREAIFHGLKVGYEFFVDIFMKAFSWLFIGVGYIGLLFTKIFKWMFQRGENKGVKIEPPEPIEIEEHIEKLATLPPILKTILSIVFKVLLILLVLYIIVKVLKQNRTGKRVEEEYLEEREFISLEKKKEKRRRSIFKPKESRELIRYYYKKFLDKCIGKNVPISKADTTFDINKKAEKIYNRGLIDKFRDIYVKTRYGEKKVEDEELAQYMDIYKKM